MMDGIIDIFEVIDSLISDGFKPDVDEEGRIIQSEEETNQYIKRFKKYVENGEILRYSMHRQTSALSCYKGLDDYINRKRQQEVDRLNTEYYREKVIKHPE